MATVSTVPAAEGQSVVLAPISWQFYEAMLREIGDQHVRLTYDDGSLEIMSPSPLHEKYGEVFARFIIGFTEELDIPLSSGGTTTFKNEDLKKGLEPDKCYWVQNEERMRGKETVDLSVDPPPDLAIEIDITTNSRTRLNIYQALGVGEVWRFDGTTLTVYRRQRAGKLVPAPRSGVFPFLPLAEFLTFVAAWRTESETSLGRRFRTWVRETLGPLHEEQQERTRRRPPKK